MAQTKTYIAKQGDRLDNIFERFYGAISPNNYDTGYNAFILANIHLIDLPIFKGGEIVNLPTFSTESTKDEVVGIWE